MHLSISYDKINIIDKFNSEHMAPHIVEPTTLFFLYKNIFYKNIKADICEILRIS